MTTPSKTPNDAFLIAEYALGVLPFEEREALKKRIASDPHLQDMLAQWDQHLVSLADEYEAIIAPSSVLSAAEARLFGAEHGARASWWNSLQLWRNSALAAVASVMVLVGLLFYDQTKQDVFQTDFIAEIKNDAGDLRLVSAFDAAQKHLKFNRVEGQAKANRALEIWLIADGGQPISLGVVPDKAGFSITLSPELAAKMSSMAVLAISDEPQGGSPTGQPTGDVLAAGKISQI